MSGARSGARQDHTSDWTMSLIRRTLAPVVIAALVPLALCAQQQPQQTPPQPQPPQLPRVAASTRATVSMALNGRYVGDRWFPGTASVSGPAQIQIDYGQPHLRGRQMIGGNEIPMDSVWRMGANLPTRLSTDVGLTIGASYIPPGVYALYALPRRGGWQLIVNRQYGQWGTDYDQSQDVARIDMRVRTLTDPVESLSIYLVPKVLPQGAPPVMPSGLLKIVWEKTELTADWRVGR